MPTRILSVIGLSSLAFTDAKFLLAAGSDVTIWDWNNVAKVQEREFRLGDILNYYYRAAT